MHSHILRSQSVTVFAFASAVLIIVSARLVAYYIHGTATVSVIPPPAFGELPVRRVAWYTDLIVFPVLWLAFLAYAITVRRSFAAVLGEASADWQTTATITARAIVPLVLIGAVQNAFSTLVPHWSFAGDDTDALAVRVSASVVLMLIGLALEGLAAVSGFREQWGQNTGRAVLTWLAPYLSCVGLAVLLNLFVS